MTPSWHHNGAMSKPGRPPAGSRPKGTALNCGNAEEVTWGKVAPRMRARFRKHGVAPLGAIWRHLVPPRLLRPIGTPVRSATPETGTAAAAEPPPDGAGQAVPGPMSRPRVRVTRAAAGQPPSAPPHASPHPCGPADSPEHHRARSAAPAQPAPLPGSVGMPAVAALTLDGVSAFGLSIPCQVFTPASCPSRRPGRSAGPARPDPR